MNSSNHRKIAEVGLLSTLLVSVVFYFWSKEFVHTEALLKSALLGATLQLAVWFLYQKTRFYALAILPVLLGTVLFSYVPYASIGVAVLFIGLIVIFLKDRSDRTLPFSTPMGFLWGTLYAVVCFMGTAGNVGDTFVNEKLHQLSLNPDTLFHASLATMIKNYHQIATGLHGFRHVHYHFFSHFLYGSTARLLNIETYEVYGYCNFIVFAPLLIIGFVYALDEVTKTHPKMFLLSNLLVLGGPLSGACDWWQGIPFISESYLVGLVLFSGALSILISIVRGKDELLKRTWVAAAYLPFLTLSKISLGLMLWVAISLVILRTKELALKTKFQLWLLFGIIEAASYAAARTTPIPDLEVHFRWGYYQDIVRHDPNFLRFLVLAFPFFFLLLPAFFLLKWEKKLDEQMRTWILIFSTIFFLGFCGLNITIDSSGYYFSNPHVYFALPILAVSLQPAVVSFKNKVRPLARSLVYLRGVYFLIAISALYLCLNFIPREFSNLRGIKRTIALGSSFQNPYFDYFKAIHDDPDSRLMVYIPKSETTFWQNTDGKNSPWSVDQPINMPFYIPLMTGKPAIFGLPEKSLTFFRGFESYSDEDYRASMRPEYSNSEVCLEAQKLGFHGFYKVTSRGSEKHLCPI